MKTVLSTVVIAIVRALAHCFGCCCCVKKGGDKDETARND